MAQIHENWRPALTVTSGMSAAAARGGGGRLTQAGEFTGKDIVSCSYRIGLIEGMIRSYLKKEKSS